MIIAPFFALAGAVLGLLALTVEKRDQNKSDFLPATLAFETIAFVALLYGV